MRRATILLMAALALSACRANLTPVANIALVASQVEDSVDQLVTTSKSLYAAHLLTREQLAAVATAADKIGRLGSSLHAGLVDYQRLKIAGADTTAQVASLQNLIADITAALNAIGRQVPNGTVQAIDQLVVTVFGEIAQIKAGLL